MQRLVSIGACARFLVAALVAGGACRCSNPAVEGGSDSGTTLHDDGVGDSQIPVDVAETAASDVTSDSEDSGPTGWRPVSEAAGCPLFEANVNEVSFAPLTWSACGTGCSVSASGLSKFPAHRGTSGGRALSADIHLLLDEPVDAGLRVRTVRLSDGKTLAAVELRTTTIQCLPLGADTNATYFGFAGPKGTKTFAGAHLTSTGLVWSKAFIALPAVPLAVFEWNAGYGLSLDDGTVRSVRIPDEASLTTVASDGLSFVATGIDDLAVWSAPGGSGLDVLRGFNRKRGMAETFIAKTDASLIASALSAERLVVVGVSGTSIAEGKYASVRWSWTPRPAQPSEVAIVDGPSIPVDAGALRVVTGGDYAAVLGCHLGVTDNKACTVHVVQMSTRKTWRIGPRAGEAFAKLIAMSASELVIGVVDYPLTAISRKEIHRFLRLDLTKLDDLAAAWP